jgi:hypothetical protein
LHEKVQRKQNNKKKKNRESCRRKDQRGKRGGPRQMVFSKAERNYMHTWILTAYTFL